MFGGSKYSTDDVEDARTLKNGAVAGYVRNAEGKRVWRIVTGASGDYLRSIGPKKGSNRSYAALSPRAAKMAFNRHYKNRKGSPRGNRQARTYDLNHSGNVIADTRYRRSPHRYDYQGVDTGSKSNRRMSGAQLAAAQKRIANARMAKGLRGESQVGGASCGFNTKSRSCSKKATGNPEWCEVGPKGRCRKSPSGRKNAPKNPKNVARGQSLGALKRSSPGRPRRVSTQGWDIQDAINRGPAPAPSPSRGRPSRVHKVTGHRAPLMGSKGSACVDLVEDDCLKHPACDYRIRGRGKSPSCGRKKQKAISGGGNYW